jgi:short subunit dehydrogenase-like uncharacterized protein
MDSDRALDVAVFGGPYVAKVTGRGDPGYQATAVMFGESALCLALDRGRPPRGGVLTPARGGRARCSPSGSGPPG